MESARALEANVPLQAAPDSVLKGETTTSGPDDPSARQVWQPVCMSPIVSSTEKSDIEPTLRIPRSVPAIAHTGSTSAAQPSTDPTQCNTGNQQSNADAAQLTSTTTQPNTHTPHSAGANTYQEPAGDPSTKRETIKFRWRQVNKTRLTSKSTIVSEDRRRKNLVMTDCVRKPATHRRHIAGNNARISELVEYPEFSINVRDPTKSSSPFQFNRQQWLKHFTKPLSKQPRMSTPPSDWHMRSYFRLLREDGLERIRRMMTSRKVASGESGRSIINSFDTKMTGAVDGHDQSSVVPKATAKKSAATGVSATEDLLHRNAAMPSLPAAATTATKEDSVYELLQTQYLRQHDAAIALALDSNETQVSSGVSADNRDESQTNNRNVTSPSVGSLPHSRASLPGMHGTVNSTASNSATVPSTGTQKQTVDNTPMGPNQTRGALSNYASQTTTAMIATSSNKSIGNTANIALSNAPTTLAISDTNRTPNGQSSTASAATNATTALYTNPIGNYTQPITTQPGSATLTTTSPTFPLPGQPSPNPSYTLTNAPATSTKQVINGSSGNVVSHGVASKVSASNEDLGTDTAKVTAATKKTSSPGSRAVAGSAGAMALEAGVTINGVSAEKYRFSTPGPGLYDAISNGKEVKSSLVINLYYSGYSLGRDTDGVISPYDRSSHEILDAIDNRILPLELVSLFEIIPGVKRVKGGIFVEIRDHREPSSLDFPAPIVSRVFLKPTPVHVVSYAHEIALEAAQKEWSERELLQIEAKVIAATNTQDLCLDPSPFVHYANISSHYNRYKLHAVLHDKKCKSGKRRASSRQPADVHWDFAANLFEQGVEANDTSLSEVEDDSENEVEIIDIPPKRSASTALQPNANKRHKADILRLSTKSSPQEKVPCADRIYNSWTERISGRAQSNFAVLNFLGRLRGSTDSSASPLHTSLDVTVCNRSRVRDPYSSSSVGPASAANALSNSRVVVKLPTTRPEIPPRLSTGAIHCRTIVFQGKAGSTGLDIVLNRNRVYEGILRIVKSTRSAESTMKQFVLGDQSRADHYVSDFKTLYKLEGNYCSKDETFYPPSTIVSKPPVLVDAKYGVVGSMPDVSSVPLQASVSMPTTAAPSYAAHNMPKPTQPQNIYQNGQKLGTTTMTSGKSVPQKNYVQSSAQLSTAPLPQQQIQQRGGTVQQKQSYSTTANTATSSSTAYAHSSTRAAPKSQSKPNQRQMQQQFKIERRASSTGTLAMGATSAAPTANMTTPTPTQNSAGGGGVGPTLNKFTGVPMNTGGGTRPLPASAVYQPTGTSATPQQSYATSAVQPQLKGATPTYNPGYLPTTTSNAYIPSATNTYISNANAMQTGVNGLQTNYTATTYANPTYQTTSTNSTQKQFSNQLATNTGNQYADSTGSTAINHLAVQNPSKQSGGHALPVHTKNLATTTNKQTLNSSRRPSNATKPATGNNSQSVNTNQQQMGKQSSIQANHQSQYDSPAKAASGSAPGSGNNVTIPNRLASSISTGLQSVSGNSVGSNGNVGSSGVLNPSGVASSATTSARRTSTPVSRRSSASSTASQTATTYLPKQPSASLYQQSVNQHTNLSVPQLPKPENTQSAYNNRSATDFNNTGQGIASTVHGVDKSVVVGASTGSSVIPNPGIGAQSQESVAHKGPSSVQLNMQPQTQAARCTRIESNNSTIETSTRPMLVQTAKPIQSATPYAHQDPSRQIQSAHNAAVIAPIPSSVQEPAVLKAQTTTQPVCATYTATTNSKTAAAATPDPKTLGLKHTIAGTAIPRVNARNGNESTPTTASFDYGTATKTPGAAVGGSSSVTYETTVAMSPGVGVTSVYAVNVTPTVAGDATCAKIPSDNYSPGTHSTPGAPSNNAAVSVATAHHIEPQTSGQADAKSGPHPKMYTDPQRIIHTDRHPGSIQQASFQQSENRLAQLPSQSALQSQPVNRQCNPKPDLSRPSVVQAQWSPRPSEIQAPPSAGNSSPSMSQSQSPAQPLYSTKPQVLTRIDGIDDRQTLGSNDHSKQHTKPNQIITPTPLLSVDTRQSLSGERQQTDTQSLPKMSTVQASAVAPQVFAHHTTSQQGRPSAEETPLVGSTTVQTTKTSPKPPLNLEDKSSMIQALPQQSLDKLQESRLQETLEHSRRQLKGELDSPNIQSQQGEVTPRSPERPVISSARIPTHAQVASGDPQLQTPSTAVGASLKTLTEEASHYKRPQPDVQLSDPVQALPPSPKTTLSHVSPPTQQTSQQTTSSPPSTQPQPSPRTYQTRQKSLTQF